VVRSELLQCEGVVCCLLCDRCLHCSLYKLRCMHLTSSLRVACCLGHCVLASLMKCGKRKQFQISRILSCLRFARNDSRSVSFLLAPRPAGLDSCGAKTDLCPCHSSYLSKPIVIQALTAALKNVWIASYKKRNPAQFASPALAQRERIAKSNSPHNKDSAY
jgi:hypothetical protein